MLSRNGEETAIYYSQMAYENVTDIGSGLWLSEENLIWTRRLLGYLLTLPLAIAFVCSLPHTNAGFVLNLTSKSGSNTIFIYLLHPLILNAVSQGYKFFYSKDLLLPDNSAWWLIVLGLTPLLAIALASDTCVKYTSLVIRPKWLQQAFCRGRLQLQSPGQGVVLAHATSVSPPGSNIGYSQGQMMAPSCGTHSSSTSLPLKFEDDE
jgi:hypothetical protein